MTIEQAAQPLGGRALPAEAAWAGPRPVTPQFAVVGAVFVEDAAAPTLRFELEVSESSGREIFTIALSAQINIDPARRSYDTETRGRLVELFGEPERWSATTRSFLWSHASTLVPSFSGQTRFALPVPCTFDLELAAAKYFYSLPGGTVPLSFHYSGSVLHRADDGQIQMVAIPWSCSSQWRMPIATWRRMMDRHYPNSCWIRLHPDTAELLRRRKAARGLVSLDVCVVELLEGTPSGEPRD